MKPVLTKQIAEAMTTDNGSNMDDNKKKPYIQNLNVTDYKELWFGQKLSVHCPCGHHTTSF